MILDQLPGIYGLLIPLAFYGFVFALLLTPIVGRFSKKYGLIDLPSHLRGTKDKTKERRIHKEPTPLGGGLAVIVPFILISLLVVDPSKPVIGLILGTLIIFVTGLIDDRYNLSARTQFIFQWVAAIAVVIFGSNIPIIQIPFDGFLDLNIWRIDLYQNYGIDLPGDLLTAFWIVLVTNALNWVNGTDGLAEGVSAISAFAMMFISVELGDTQTAILAAIFAGSVLGFLPFNFYPAKIFSGAGGPTYGFILATLAILGSSKLPTAIILLSLPLLDMAWVLIGRIRAHKVFNPFKVLAISDRTHLHHRLLDLGLNVKEVAYVEYLLVALISTFAFFTADLEKITIFGVVLTSLLLIFTILSILNRRGSKLKKKKEPGGPIKDDESPESKYVY